MHWNVFGLLYITNRRQFFLLYWLKRERCYKEWISKHLIWNRSRKRKNSLISTELFPCKFMRKQEEVLISTQHSQRSVPAHKHTQKKISALSRSDRAQSRSYFLSEGVSGATFYIIRVSRKLFLALCYNYFFTSYFVSKVPSKFLKNQNSF